MVVRIAALLFLTHSLNVCIAQEPDAKRSWSRRISNCVYKLRSKSRNSLHCHDRIAGRADVEYRGSDEQT